LALIPQEIASDEFDRCRSVFKKIQQAPVMEKQTGVGKFIQSVA
jgi:hypothetical protein